MRRVVVIFLVANAAVTGEVSPTAGAPRRPAVMSGKRAAQACVRRRNVVFEITTSFLNPSRSTGNGCWPWIRTGRISQIPRCSLQAPAGPVWAYDDTGHADDVTALNRCRKGRGSGFEYMAYTPGLRTPPWKKVVAPNVTRYYAELYRTNLTVPFEAAALASWRARPAFAIPMLDVGMGVASDARVAAAVRQLCVESPAGIGLFAGSRAGPVSVQRRGVILRALNACTTQR